MINRFLAKNSAVWLIAILLSLLIWMVAFQEEMPKSTTSAYGEEKSQTFTDIPIRVVNLPQGMRAILSVDKLESVTLIGSSNWLSWVTGNDISAYIDVKGKDEGQHTIEVGIDKSNYLLVSAKQPQLITVTLEAIISREFPVEIAHVGMLTPGYFLRGSAVEPDQVTVRGPRPKVEAIERILSVVSLNYADASFAQDTPVQLLDAHGAPLDEAQLEIIPRTVHVQQELETIGELPFLEAEVSLPEGVLLLGQEILPATLQVFATPEMLGNITSIPLPEIDLSAADEDALSDLGLDAEDPLWQLLLGDAELQPWPGETVSQSIVLTLELPPGMRWAGNAQDVPPQIELLLQVMRQPNQLEADEEIYSSVYGAVYGNAGQEVYGAAYETYR